MVEKHCLYAGFEGSICLCMYPGMECVDAECSGYDNCSDYTEGTRKIHTAERLGYPIQHRIRICKNGKIELIEESKENDR